MKETKFEEAVERFVDAFEEVFHRDWSYTRGMVDVGADVTFIKPGVADETEDWGNRGALLEAYRDLAALLHQRCGRPLLDATANERTSYLMRRLRSARDGGGMDGEARV